MIEGQQIDPREPVKNVSVAVGLTNVEVCGARVGTNYRRDILIRNISPNAADIISVSFNTVAVANVGIVLRQYESFCYSQDAGPMIFQGQVNAICATANGVLAVLER